MDSTVIKCRMTKKTPSPRTSKPKRMNTDGPVSMTFMAQITTNVMSTAANKLISVTNRMCERREITSDCSIYMLEHKTFTYKFYPGLREPVEDLEEHERREEHHDVEVDFVPKDREREARLRDRIANVLVQKLRGDVYTRAYTHTPAYLDFGVAQRAQEEGLDETAEEDREHEARVAEDQHADLGGDQINNRRVELQARDVRVVEQPRAREQAGARVHPELDHGAVAWGKARFGFLFSLISSMKRAKLFKSYVAEKATSQP